jgi:ATP-dependent helicase/nuclease subunit A
MTTHKAKGLQFPVVILADPTAGLVSPSGCDRWIDLDNGLCAQRLLACAPWELLGHEAEEERAERAEGERIAYVAATRAQDLLVVCAVGDTEYQDGWLSPPI